MTTPLIFSKVHGRLTKVLGRLIFFISTFFPCPCKVGSSLEMVNFLFSKEVFLIEVFLVK